jgi:hypothetical protein
MSFRQAVDRFRAFLGEQCHAGTIIRIRPSDLRFWMDKPLVRPSDESTRHAEDLFVRAANRGFGVAFEGLVRLDHSIYCFVFAPDDGEDAASHFIAPPITMKVRDPLKSAGEANAIQRWAARNTLPDQNRRRTLQFFGYELDHRDWTKNV